MMLKRFFESLKRVRIIRSTKRNYKRVVVLGNKPDVLIFSRLFSHHSDVDMVLVEFEAIPVHFSCRYLLQICKRRFTRLAPLASAIECLDAYLVLSLMDNADKTFQIANLLPDVQVLIFQQGVRNLGYVPPGFRSNCRYFVFGEFEKQKLNQSDGVVVFGSLKNNLFGKCILDPPLRVQWVSSFRPTWTSDSIIFGRQVSYEQFEVRALNFVFPIVVEFCREYGLQLEVLARSSVDAEREFYRQFEGVEFLERSHGLCSYENLKSDSIVVGITSTFLIETSARHGRVGVFSLRYDNYGNRLPYYDYGYPNEIPRDECHVEMCTVMKKKEIWQVLQRLKDIEQREASLSAVMRHMNISSIDDVKGLV